ncbi:phosphoenolpyruvate--protein phosphotransferase PtsP [Vibrio sp. UCD-FRSSP16_10]|uniref:phosphoenolpyruvate--protein phosphotransferase n=1 Tax=unclassified Vibrio TaxID=2614977 RepID=UPI0007FBE30E|nr:MULTISPECIES: phosphoenolpyruvate--protein phosphotransferase [unclassified Vibrio]OBT06638.1 phosphoenolpyruvate--protein phosphotransferase PtsP [Vibrio sp. UCD-FRSSP16_30]OBT12335.1 phosphoenolpyruvate--protein phosphotransferase PtsP [Vibrio sp. UCD-FRSSP16_10]
MLNQLRDIVEHVSRVENIHQALEVFVRSTCDAINSECCTIYLSNHQKQRLELMATKGLTFSGECLHIGFKEGLVGLVHRTAEPLNVAQASLHPNYKYFPQLGEDVYQAFLATPIVHRKRMLGVVVIQQKTPRLFSDTEESFLVTLAAQLAVLIASEQQQGNWLLQEKRHSVVSGLSACNGIAIGPIWRGNDEPLLSDVSPASATDIERDKEWLLVAIEGALKEFRRLRKQLDSDLNKDALAIFDLFTHLLNDPKLRGDLIKQVEKGDTADWALRQVIERYSTHFARMSDIYLQQRSQDVRELGQRLLYFLYHSQVQEVKLEHPVIFVVNELTTTLLASVPREMLLGVVSSQGGVNSHAAILSRALGVPSVIGPNLKGVEEDGKHIIVDGYNGEVLLSPTHQEMAEYQQLLAEEQEVRSMVESELCMPAVTLDKTPVTILLNTGLGVDMSYFLNDVIDGIGLYRTEISFIIKQAFPSEDEQVDTYRKLLAYSQGKPVVMRTLDIGGDKSLPYFPMEEENPFLGWRGIRFTLDHPDIFLVQVRAMMIASVGQKSELNILLPMVSGAPELDSAFSLINQAYHEVVLTYPSVKKPKIGIMLEVPSMIYLLPAIAKRIDFVSVGTNDLTQYLLAVDRNNSQVSELYEVVHPAVLLALKQIQVACEEANLPVSVCGELAGDPIGVLVLLGLGFTKLSMSSANVASIKYVIRQSNLDDLKVLANAAMTQSYASEVHQLAFDYLENRGLAGFVRPGKH